MRPSMIPLFVLASYPSLHDIPAGKPDYRLGLMSRLFSVFRSLETLVCSTLFLVLSLRTSSTPASAVDRSALGFHHVIVLFLVWRITESNR